MPKRKEPELDPKEQAKRFREAAKEVDVDAKKAERAFHDLAESHSRNSTIDNGARKTKAEPS